ncbi:MAG TPA: hypothetical protein VJ698_08870 [Noviherbaspirillum sp.]|uniref:hypothetical protein n=1 Tax=Noviherbaspirillum sp. TaxID=1926288 RepID=UPI002B4670E7|nr:hypothetical protein [Noviherbaspirillum sp.]HJV85578.1 hypothetical protein [Noviherbaspirillum sp.]
MRLRGAARIVALAERKDTEAAQLTSAKHSFTISVVDFIGGALFLEAYRKQDAQT